MSFEKLTKALISLGFLDASLENRIISSSNAQNEFTCADDKVLITYISYEAGEVRESHVHPELRVTFIRSGSATLRYNETDRLLQTGDVAVMLPDISHSLTVHDKQPLRICELVIHLS